MIEYWKAVDAVKSTLSRVLEFEVSLRNVGLAPATDITVEIQCPDEVWLLEKNDLPKKPDAPLKPEQPRSWMDSRQHFSRISSGIQKQLIENQLRLPHRGRQISDDRRTVSIDISMLKHGHDKQILSDVFLLLPSYEEADSFSCGYRITAGNMIDRIDGKLAFRVTKT